MHNENKCMKPVTYLLVTVASWAGIFVGCGTTGPAQPRRSFASCTDSVAPSTGSAFELSPAFLKDLKVIILDGQILAASTKKEANLLDVAVGSSVAKGSLISCVVLIPDDCVVIERPWVSRFQTQEGHQFTVVYVGSDWSKCDRAVLLEFDRNGRVVRSGLAYRDGQWRREAGDEGSE
ncbi:hypothetical protein LCGC14_1259460 [marine sediment metagenome]|uniref:Lipoprotein n=1 Tax=marine sediment metagenome TaxID=412755 RepID=A0A0F9L149_9ZZZZ